MEAEKANYIIPYFSHLLNEKEKLAFRHISSTIKLSDIISEDDSLLKMYKKKGWISSDETVLDLIKDGNDTFEINAAERILKENPQEVFFNNCPKCKKLARTPLAKQCRHCGYNWHNSI